MKIIPAIDLLNGQCVRLQQGDYDKSTLYSADPILIAQQFEKLGASLLHIVDLDGARAGHPLNINTILKIAKSVNIPLQVGGGIRTVQEAEMYLESGIYRIVIGTSAIKNPVILQKLLAKYDAERIVIGIDFKNQQLGVNGWSESIKLELSEFLLTLKNLGVTTLITTDIVKDGMLQGPNTQLIKMLIPYGFKVILAGGISHLNDIKMANAASAEGVIIGKAIYEGLIDIPQALILAEKKNTLAKRIIPCLDIKNGRVVKGLQYENLKDAGDPIELGQFYSDSGADELAFLDISASIESRNTQYKLAEKIAENINIPFTIGGGITTCDNIQQLLQAGADKVLIGTAAVNQPELISQATNRFGSQCIVISLDIKFLNNRYEIFTHGGTRATGIEALSFSKKMASQGAGELLINSIDKDGTQQGYDITLLKQITSNVNIPVIASSGAGCKTHFLDALQMADVDAVLAASLFHSKKLSIADLKHYLTENNIRVRL
jgi:cyclase